MLVHQVVAKEISWVDFLRDYNNFYLHYGLQGDEIPPQDQGILASYLQEINFHKRVQFEILGLVFDAPLEQRSEYLAAGRIDQVEAVSRLTRLAHESGLDAMLQRPSLKRHRAQ